MACVATIQLIVDEDDPAEISDSLRRAAKLLEEQGIALCVRTHDAGGQPMTALAPMRATLAMARGIFTPESAWPEHYVLPYGRMLAVDETDTGMLTIRLPACIQKDGSHSGDIDLRINVTEEGVQTSLHPVGVLDEIDISGSTSSLTFERAASIQGATPRPAPMGVQGRLFDTTTGRPIVGPAFTVPAVVRYDYAVQEESGFRLSGVQIDDYLDELARHMRRRVGDDTQRLYLTDDGTVIPESRVELQIVSAEQGDAHGARPV